ncbi:MAG TPA: spermidine/putrescine ABC transporter substrate-binding protein [Candidatus Onthenecus intestinigallinarum]|uniref:Spermidine/putrescine ABC transporter substrate-binding protein n=1 Tax=Candidatus Onthenecus intestinigallinarum TaxID=2840875 RepID=A0A9D0Z7W8_9FIRM|nr:spermidine/putrescine ABC transporter substrate-binding protein [Candidatus Onthenecus intestinigallinarum]
MKKLLSVLLALSMLAALPLLSSAEEEKVLNIFSWDGYVDYASVIQPFEQQTGIKVNYAPFSTNDEMFKKLQENGASEYDLVIASDYILNTARLEGLMLPLDKEQLPNFANLDERFISQYFDPDNEYVVPYMSGIPLIVYNPDMVQIEIDGFEDLWDPSLADSIGLIDDARVSIGMVLLSMGQSMNTTDDAVLAQAKEKLFALRENIHVLEYENLHNSLISGDISVAYTFTPYVALALDANPNLQVVWPKEGLGFGIDGAFIPANAPHPDNAHTFLNYLLDGQVAAVTAEWQYYCTPNAAAQEFLSDAYKNNPVFNGIYDRFGDAEYVMNLGADESKFQDIWTEFKLLF